MNFKKIVSTIAAAAIAVSTLAVSAFAYDMNSEYTGAWSASATIPKSEFAAIGGDVKVVLNVERKDPLVGEGNYLLKPMNICSSWDAITDQLTTDSAIRKGDGFIVVGKDVTTIEFVVPESTWSAFVDYEGGDGPDAGLAFQVNDVIIMSADLSAGAPEGDFTVVSEEESAEIMKNGVPAASAPAADAPAADAGADTSAATGNTSAAVIVSVMALAGAAAIVAKKRK